MRTLFSLIVTLAVLLAVAGCRGDKTPADPIPECAEDGAPCGEGRICFRDNDDLGGGYCSPPCDADSECPSGTRCSDLCMVVCKSKADCPRPYQICGRHGVCETAMK